MNLSRISVLCGFIAIFILAACDPGPSAHVMVRDWTWKAATIDLAPTGQPGDPMSPPGSVTLPANQGCTSGSGPRLGCVKFAREDTGTLTFALVGSHEIKTCSDAGVQRVITKIEFTDRASGTDPEKGDFYASVTNPLPSVLKTQAITALDVNSGEAYFKSNHTQGETRVNLINVNGPGAVSAGGKTLWWRVTISKCSNGHIWRTDPRLVNGGMD